MAAAAEMARAEAGDDDWAAHSESAFQAAGQLLQDMRNRGVEDNAALVSKWMLNQLRADRRRAESEARRQERAKTKQKPEGDRTERDPKARTKKPLPSPESGAEQLDLNEPLYAREWLYAGHYVRKYVTATIAQSKVGKSLVIMMEYLAMATGRRDIPHRAPIRNLALGEKLRVMYVNGEDPIEEVKLRFRALAQHFGVSQEDLDGWLFIGSGRKTDFVVARDSKGAFVHVAPVVDGIVETIRTLKIDALIIDPLVAFHNVPENDNSKMDSVIQLFRDIADECNIAVEIVAHTRKTGEAVTTQDFRGGGGQIGGVRAVRTVNLMTETEGKDDGLEPGEYKWLIGLDNDSANMSEPGGNWTRWLRKVSVEVPVVDMNGNATVEKVGAVEAWSWPSKEEAREAKDAAARERLTPEKIEAIIGAIREARRSSTGTELRADVKAKYWAGHAVMPAIGLDPDDKGDKSRMDAWFKMLVKSEDLVEYVGLGRDRHQYSFFDLSPKNYGGC